MYLKKIGLRCILLLSFAPCFGLSQQAKNGDPLNNMISFFEFGVLSHITEPRLAFEINSLDDDRFRLAQSPFVPNFDFFVNVGVFGQNGFDEFMSLLFKSGVFYQNRQAFLIDSNAVNFQLRERYLTIPLSLGVRMPQAYRTVKNEQFRANELFFGLNIGFPIKNVITEKDAPFALESSLEKQYSRIGFHLELAHTSYNTLGKGHRLGLRYQFDTVMSSLNSVSMSMVNYHSIGVFYNLINDRTLRRSSPK